jgi:archaellum biogenesis ATPase FlaH
MPDFNLLKGQSRSVLLAETDKGWAWLSTNMVVCFCDSNGRGTIVSTETVSELVEKIEAEGLTVEEV